MGFAAEQRDAMECMIRAGGSFMAAVPLAEERSISKPYLRGLMYHKTKYAEGGYMTRRCAKPRGSVRPACAEQPKS